MNFPKKHKKYKAPGVGDIGYIRDTDPAFLSIVQSSGDGISLVDIDKKDEERIFLSKKIAGIGFKSILKKIKL